MRKKQPRSLKTDLYIPTTTTFTATGSLNQSRGGYGYGILSGGTHSGDLVVIGGECAASTLASGPIGTLDAASPGGDFYELFSPSTGTWTVGTATAPATPANAPASASLP